MAGSVNKVILVGNLGQDPESRSFQNGGEVVNLRIATSETYKDRDGNRQEKTQWHSIAIFAEGLAKVAKGAAGAAKDVVKNTDDDEEETKS